MPIAVNKPSVDNDRSDTDVRRRVVVRQESAWSPGLAAVLSVVMPGLGQIYNGQIIFGLFLMLMAFLGYFLIIPGALVHLYSIYQAYRRAERRRDAEHWRLQQGW